MAKGLIGHQDRKRIETLAEASKAYVKAHSADVSTDTIRLWKAALNLLRSTLGDDKRLNATTTANIVSQLFNWLVESELLSKNPAKNAKVKKVVGASEAI